MSDRHAHNTIMCHIQAGTKITITRKSTAEFSKSAELFFGLILFRSTALPNAVLQTVQADKNESSLDSVQQRKLRWIGQILRHESLLCDIIEGRMMGKATMGRKRLQMVSDVISKQTMESKPQATDKDFIGSIFWIDPVHY